MTNRAEESAHGAKSLAVLLCACTVISAPAAASGPWPAQSWPTATPTEAGMDRALLEQARDHALTGGGAGMIIRSGKLVFSWGDPTRRFDLKSTTKSIGVTALGLAMQDGLVGLADAAQLHLPGLGVPPETNAETGWLGEITVRQLATHSAGFDKPGGFIEVFFEPGTAWSYSDGGANWLADLLTVRYGMDLEALMFRRVFDPLGIRPADLTWRDNAFRSDTVNGIKRREFGSGIRADVDAMARIGYLYLRRGAWEGRRVVPSAFVASASRLDPSLAGLPVTESGNHPDATSHYGLLWWNNGDGSLLNVPPDAFWSWGLADSLIIVIPSFDIVAVRAGDGWRPGWDSDYAVIRPFIEPVAQSVTGTSISRPPAVSIEAPADGPQTASASSIAFAGSALDAEDGDLTNGLKWFSDRDGLIGMGGSFSTSVLSSGTHVITASVSDSGGLSGAANVIVAVEQAEGAGGTPPTVSISQPVDDASVTSGDSVDFAGSASDEEDGDLTAALQWTSDLDGPFGMGGSFSSSSLSVGTHTITASVTDSDAEAGSASLTLIVTIDKPPNEPPVVKIDSPSEGATFDQGETVTFTGSATDLQDGSLTVSLQWSSSRDGALGSGGSLAVPALSVGTHTVSASVVDTAGASASDSIRIEIAAGSGGPTPSPGSTGGGSAGLWILVLCVVRATAALRRIGLRHGSSDAQHAPGQWSATASSSSASFGCVVRSWHSPSPFCTPKVPPSRSRTV
ncbi:MAG TPA: serine hydrolase [Woeseiaceae bacterium]|nr:serine hydrolase [Woeseiaceae bacterium]